uniref:Protein NDR1 n=1 Tax=Noccaea caerulescens TaxID=107243 RepID=A0A1J3GR75_NOCCA
MDQDGGKRNCCSCLLSFIFTAGLTSLFLWLSLRPNKPKCTIEKFYVPALNKTLNSRTNTTLNFMVRLVNPNRDQGIYYDDVHVSLSSANSSVANYTVPGFYQGHKKKAKKWGQALPFNNQTVLRAVLPNGSAVFRVDLKTQVRFKIIGWKTKRYGIEVGADVEVNGDGVKAKKKGIKMKGSDSSTRLRSYFPICVLMNLLVFFAIS